MFIISHFQEHKICIEESSINLYLALNNNLITFNLEIRELLIHQN